MSLMTPESTALLSQLPEMAARLNRDVISGRYQSIADEYSLFTLEFYQALGQLTEGYLKAAKACEAQGDMTQAVYFYRRNYLFVGDSEAADRLGLNASLLNQSKSSNDPVEINKTLDYDALMTRGFQFLGGIGESINPRAAYLYFKQAQRVDPKSVETADVLSYCYQYGIGTPVDRSKAVKFNQYAARQQEYDNGVTTTQCYPPALFRQFEFCQLGLYRQEGIQLPNTNAGPHVANRLLIDCAQSFGSALHTLAVKLQQNDDDDPQIPHKTLDEVERFYLRSSSLGVRHSHYSLGINALGVSSVGSNSHLVHNADIPAAITWFNKAKDSEPRAYLQLGRIYNGYFQALNSVVDHDLAFDYFSSGQFYPPARIELAKYYLPKTHVAPTSSKSRLPKAPDPNTAARLLHDAAKQARQELYDYRYKLEFSLSQKQPRITELQCEKYLAQKFSTKPIHQHLVQPVVKEARKVIFACYDLLKDDVELHYHYVMAFDNQAAFDKAFKENPTTWLTLLINDNQLTYAEKIAMLEHTAESLIAFCSPADRDRLHMALGESYFYHLISHDVITHAKHLHEAQQDPKQHSSIPERHAKYLYSMSNYRREREKAQTYYEKISAESDSYGMSRVNLFIIYQELAEETEQDQQRFRYQYSANQAVFAARKRTDNPFGRLHAQRYDFDYEHYVAQYFPTVDPLAHCPAPPKPGLFASNTPTARHVLGRALLHDDFSPHQRYQHLMDICTQPSLALTEKEIANFLGDAQQVMIRQVLLSVIQQTHYNCDDKFNALCAAVDDCCMRYPQHSTSLMNFLQACQRHYDQATSTQPVNTIPAEALASIEAELNPPNPPPTSMLGNILSIFRFS